MVNRDDLLHHPTHNRVQTTRNEQIDLQTYSHVRKRDEMFTLTKSVSIQTPNGNVELQVGFKFLITSREATTCVFVTSTLLRNPISATDLK